MAMRCVCYIQQMDASTPAERLKRARMSCGYETAAAAAIAHGWNVNTYASNENGNAPYSYRKAKAYAEAFGVRWDWLLDGAGTPYRSPTQPFVEPPPLPPLDRRKLIKASRTPIVGTVGADLEGVVRFYGEQDAGQRVPPPPGGTKDTLALRISGHGLRGFADDGALVYFEDLRRRPSRDMINQVVVAETMDGEVLVGRLHRGSKRSLFDLHSLAGPRRPDSKLRWAAHITAIIPPHQASRIIKSVGAAAACSPAKLETPADGDGTT